MDTHVDNDKGIQISIVIPIFNSEKYLRRTLESIRVQDESSIEIICIDDCSTDDSFQIIEEYSNKDGRFRCIRNDANLGTHISRIKGMESSKGRYIWMVDSDDVLIGGSISELVKISKRFDVDIIHFGTVVVNEGGLDPKRVTSMQRFTEPHSGKLKGIEVFRRCFITKEYRFNIWNKLFRRSLVESAVGEMEKSRLVKAQDEYEYFILAYNAKSYIGLPRTVCYEYHFGTGVTGSDVVDLKRMEAYCSMSNVVDALDRYSEGKGDECIRAIDICRQDLIDDCTANWFRVPYEERSKAFDKMVESWSNTETVSHLAKSSWFKPETIADSIRQSKCIRIDGGEIHTIAVYYHRLSNGGVQRVISRLIPVWRSMGYDVIIVTDEEPTEIDYQIDSDVKRFTIQDYRKTNKYNYTDRANRLKEILIENKVDLFINNAWLVSTILWDMLICQTSGVRFVTYCHNVFPLLQSSGFAFFASLPSTYRLMDGVVTLTEMDMRFWSNFNGNVHLIQNPMSFDRGAIPVSDLSSYDIIWVGRISSEKRPLDAIKIFDRVHDSIPNSNLIMVGDGDKEIIRSIKSLISSKGLESSVKLCGYSDDTSQVYKDASIFLSTSEYEGFLLTMTEAMSAGLPCVLYELPYLSIIREGDGFVQVPQGDVSRAAIEIIKILKNDLLRRELGRKSKTYSEKLYDYDLSANWKSIFDSLASYHEPSNDEIDDLMWGTMMQFYRKGIEKKNRDAELTYPKIKRYFWRTLRHAPHVVLKKFYNRRN